MLTIDEQYERIFESAKNEISDYNLKNAVLLSLFEYKTTFLKAIGGEGHHKYEGGLVEHTYNVLSLADKIMDTYGDSISRTVITAAAIWHDFGKMLTMNNKMYDSIIGHIHGSIMIATEYMSKEHVKQDLQTEVISAILFHGTGFHEQECRTSPSTLEAIILHHCDTIDAFASQYTKNSSLTKPGEAYSDKSYNNRVLYKSNYCK